MRLLCDVFLENLGLGGLGVAKVHHLVEQFVNDDKVVADGLFLEGLEIFGKDLDDFVEEEDDFGGIGVALGEGEQVEVIMADVEVLAVLDGVFYSRGWLGGQTYVDAFV